MTTAALVAGSMLLVLAAVLLALQLRDLVMAALQPLAIY